MVPVQVPRLPISVLVEEEYFALLSATCGLQISGVEGRS